MKNYIFQAFAAFKNSMVAFFSGVSFFLGPPSGMVFICFLLVLLDFITAAIIAKKQKEFQSIKVMSSVWKFMQFSIALILAHAIDTLFIDKIDFSFLNTILNDGVSDVIKKANCLALLSFIIIVREVSSIDENWVKANGWSVLGSITQFMNSKILSLFKSKTDEQVKS